MKRKFSDSPMDQVMQCLEIHMRSIDMLLSLDDVASLGKAFPVLQSKKLKAVPSWDKVREIICQTVPLQYDAPPLKSFKWGIWGDFTSVGSELRFTAGYEDTEILVVITPLTYQWFLTYRGDPEDDYSEEEEDEENLKVTDTFGHVKHNLMKQLRYNTNVLAVFHSFLSDLTSYVLGKCDQDGSKLSDQTREELDFLGYAHNNNSWSPYW